MAKKIRFNPGDRVRVKGAKEANDISIDNYLQKNNRIGTVVAILAHYRFLRMDKEVKEDGWGRHYTKGNKNIEVNIPEGYCYFAGLTELELINESKTQPPTPAELFKQGKLRKGDWLVAIEGYEGLFKEKIYQIDSIGINYIDIRFSESGSNRLDPSELSKFRLPTKDELLKAGKIKAGEKIKQVILYDYQKKIEKKSVSKKSESGKKELTPEDLKTIEATDKMLKLIKPYNIRCCTKGKYQVFGFKKDIKTKELTGPKIIGTTKDIRETYKSLGITFYHLIIGKSEFNDISFLDADYKRTKEFKDDNFWLILVNLFQGKYENKEEAVKDLRDLKERIKSKATIENQPVKKKEVKKKEVKKEKEKQTPKQQKFKTGDKIRVVNSGNIYPYYGSKAKELGATKWREGDNFEKRFGAGHKSREIIGIIKNIDKEAGVALIEVDNQEWVIGLDGLELVEDQASGAIVHCPTKKDWKKVVKAAIEDGYTWGSDTKMNNYYWYSYKGESCVDIGFGGKLMSFAPKSFYEEDKGYSQYPIISAQEYLRRIEEKKKQKIKD